ncbi:MAG: hypothetical protein JWL71_4937 [Acidobacteria bacterium]|nr:hypothetical protein [Acidobacteriota bacterium]
MEDQDRRAVLDFEAWGSPCTWTLTGAVSELRDAPGAPVEVVTKLTYGRSFSVSFPAKRQSAEIRIEMPDGAKFTLTPEGAPNDAVTLLSRETSGSAEVFTYMVNVPRRK